MKYEKEVEKICGASFSSLDDIEKQGAYGVACVLSFIDGVNPKVEDMSKHLKLTTEQLSNPFFRLLKDGVFSNRFDAKHDSWLNADSKELHYYCSWGFIAGISSGLIQKHYGRH